MKVKICGITNVEEALMAAKAGADAIGVIIVFKTRRFIDLTTAREIFKALPIFISKVVVSTLDGIPVEVMRDKIRMIEETGADCIQLHGDEPLELIKDLRLIEKTNKRMRIIKKIAVGNDKECIEKALEYEGFVDAILLDSGVGLGGTGEKHDWNVSKEVVERVKKPVILAGGLNPENIAEAIELVKPYAVDVSSGVERVVRKKDEEGVKTFLEVAKGKGKREE